MSSSCATKLELTTPAAYKCQECVAATAIAEAFMQRFFLLTGLTLVQLLRICMSQQASPSGRYVFAEAAADSMQHETHLCATYVPHTVNGLHRAFLCELYRVAR